MTLLLALSVPSAHAEPLADAACSIPYVEGISPAAGATGVPVDARLTVLMREGACGDAGGVLRLEDDLGVVLEVFDPEGEEVLGGVVYRVAPEPPLDADTRYVLTFEPFEAGAVVAEFRTGSEVAEAPAEVEPEIVSSEGWWHDDGLHAAVDVVVRAKPGALVHVVEREGDVPAVGFADDAGEAYVFLDLRPGDGDEEICVLAASEGATGELSDWTSTCAAFDAPRRNLLEQATSGCSTTGGAAGWLAVLGLLPLLRRR